MIAGTVENKLLNKRPSLGEAMLDCVPITVDDNSTNLPPPSYGSIPPSRGGRTSPFSYGPMGPPRGARTQDESHYGTLPLSRGGRYSEETYFCLVPGCNVIISRKVKIKSKSWVVAKLLSLMLSYIEFSIFN